MGTKTITETIAIDLDEVADASRVQTLQKQVAEALGKPVAFCDRLAGGGEGPEMLVIPPGTFLMGSPQSEPERMNAEGPQHKVTITKPFALARYALTFAEYDAYCVETGKEKASDKDPYSKRYVDIDRPVINVSWEDAVAYCLWLSEQTGAEYRLPTEAEWEYACRAGTTTPFWWGSTITPQQANYNSKYAYNKGLTDEYRADTVPVDQFEPNPWGLYQMHGNIEEWTQDLYIKYTSEASIDPKNLQDSFVFDRVLRSGPWNERPDHCGSASRSLSGPGRYDCHIGFRPARTLDSVAERAGSSYRRTQQKSTKKPKRQNARIHPLQKQIAEALGKPVAFRDRLKDGGEGPEMLVIPPGTFLMGFLENDPERGDHTGPQHEEAITKPFALARYALTFAEYDAYCIATGKKKPDDEWFGRLNRPVINVSWEDAVAYCQWLSEQTGAEYRLPTEAE